MVSGWRSGHAASEVDASREHPVPDVYGGVRRLELWRGAVGDLHLWQAAVVWTVQSRGEAFCQITDVHVILFLFVITTFVPLSIKKYPSVVLIFHMLPFDCLVILNEQHRLVSRWYNIYRGVQYLIVHACALTRSTSWYWDAGNDSPLTDWPWSIYTPA